MSSLADSKIPIKNLYYMLCYAWGHLEEKDMANIAREDEKDIKHLLTRILLVKLRSLIKRGFYREYKSYQEETGTLKGRILFQESINTFSFKRGKMHCEFEEMTHDIIHNQVIKSTLYALLQTQQLERQLKEEIQQLYPYFAEVTVIKLNLRIFQEIKLHRSSQHYRFVLDICRFLYESLLLNEEKGESQLVDFERDPKVMARLFEDFVRNFYKREMPEYKVHRENIYWDAEGEDTRYLPLMQTDISLESVDQKIIIDTKYYQNALTQNFGSQKLISGNLYQLFAYLSNHKKAEGEETVGMLLYPKTGKELMLEYRIKGFSIRINTIDLNRDWLSIHTRLKEIVS
ncbi:5-methylcytosine-specific restriction endonuclease system specificity protein McrC [Cytobacillus pseudoceanisediminis]|uniref:5-methylcytosine-specific restriction endonuclease system specificity protein McrC n=1 Tax=Cytobacillus pseudoceanisediminis TaxID=3051614 RepID=UPI00218BAF9E|nr:5-methylcytosine-specific restriction endonuclease system specificity protein McrC [Cytobacillus pseudoceanisediminis]UQX55095.1 5-methylcytosine-specific restriction endonuclease system specificity protein McrC [Cytobacillus pseudoceanisediminis]